MLAGEMMRERYLADALAGHVDDYDLVLIDCPPNLGLLTVNAFCAAREVLVVVSMTDRNAYKGAMALFATVNKLRHKSVDVAVTAFVRNNVDRHRSTYRLLNEALIEARPAAAQNRDPDARGLPERCHRRRSARAVQPRPHRRASDPQHRGRTLRPDRGTPEGRVMAPAAHTEHGWDQEPARPRRRRAARRRGPERRTVRQLD